MTRILVTIPEPLRNLLINQDTWERLETLGQVTVNQEGRNWTAQELADRLKDVDGVLASWGLPSLDQEVLANADRLKIVAYAAGSIKRFATQAVRDRGIVICHGAPRIAQSVAEMTLLLAMMGLRRPQDFDRRMKGGEVWPKSRGMKLYEIAGKRVGLLGLGYVGRCSARLFQAVGAEVWAYDPYVTDDQAASLGVHKADLNTVFAQCQIVSNHLPVTDETRHLVGAQQLALMQDGAVFINTARAYTVDQDALVAELAKGRIWAALDVFDPEPLPPDSPLRRMENVLLTPHAAGFTCDSYFGLGETMVAELERFFKGEPLQYQVDLGRLQIMA